MILHIINTISFIGWCGMFIVLPLYMLADYLATKYSKAKHYQHNLTDDTDGHNYKPGEFDYLKKIDESYYLPYEEYRRRCEYVTIGIDLAKGKDCAGYGKTI